MTLTITAIAIAATLLDTLALYCCCVVAKKADESSMIEHTSKNILSKAS